MSSLKSGPPKPVDAVTKVGNVQFGKWLLYRTTEKEDIWHKPMANSNTSGYDNYIQIRRINHSASEREYHVWFFGQTYFLREHFKLFYPEYEDHDTPFVFTDIQAAKDYVDRFLDRLDKLMVFT
jgi:hypothetical protein